MGCYVTNHQAKSREHFSARYHPTLSKMLFARPSSILFTLSWTVSSIINAASFFYIRDKYDYKSKSIYFLLMLESAFASICSILASTLFFYLSVMPECDSATCCSFVSFLQVFPYSQAFVSFIISLIRLKRYLLSNTESIWFDEERLVKTISLAFAMAIFSKLIGNVLYMNLAPSLCVNGTSPPLIVAIYLALPTTALMGSSAGMDIYSYYTSRHNNFDTEIPLKASVISTFMAVVAFIVALISEGLELDDDPQMKLTVVFTFIVIVTSTRNQVAIRFGFPINSINAAPAIDHEEQRSRNQRREIEYAVQRRQEAREGALILST